MEKTPVQLDKNSQVRRARRIKFLFVGVLFLVLIVVAFIGFLRKKQYQITSVRVDQAKSTDEQVIINTTNNFLSGNYLYVIPKTNALLVSKMALRNHLLNLVPSLNDVRINFVDTKELVVTLYEKEPQYVWCRTTEDCYFMDEKGMVYASAPTFSDGVFITFTGGIIPEGSPLRRVFLDKETFVGLVEIVEQLKRFPMQVTRVEYGTDITIRVSRIQNYPVGPTTAIVITKDARVAAIEESLALIIKDKSFATTLTTKGKMLEYIDLRFPGKIYYKFAKP